jgi:hypothetical protein
MAICWKNITSLFDHLKPVCLNLIKTPGGAVNRDATIGFILVALLLGGLVLFARRPAAVATPISASNRQLTGQGNIRLIPAGTGPPRYQNKEIREIEYNEDNLPTKITIIRDYTVT